MEIYNQTKTEILENVDLELGYLISDKRLVRIVPEQQEVQKRSHYETVKTYYNEDGSIKGKEVKEVVDVPYKPYTPEHEEYEDIQVYIPYTEGELIERKKQTLREWREKYFKIIDRAVWYDTLTIEQKEEVKEFRQKLLDITTTMIKPEVPEIVSVQIKE